jgi:exonuclease III
VSQSLAPRVHDSYILKEVTGSDHVPLGVVIRKE